MVMASEEHRFSAYTPPAMIERISNATGRAMQHHPHCTVFYLRQLIIGSFKTLDISAGRHQRITRADGEV